MRSLAGQSIGFRGAQSVEWPRHNQNAEAVRVFGSGRSPLTRNRPTVWFETASAGRDSPTVRGPCSFELVSKNYLDRITIEPVGEKGSVRALLHFLFWGVLPPVSAGVEPSHRRQQIAAMNEVASLDSSIWKSPGGARAE